MDAATQNNIKDKLRVIQSNNKKIKIAKIQISIIEEKMKKYVDENGELKKEINRRMGKSSLQMNLR